MKSSARVVAGVIGATSLASGALYFFRTGNQAPVRPDVVVQPAVEPEATSPRPPVAETHESAASTARSILVANGMLTLVLRAQPLGPVLAEIARKSGVNIVSPPAVDTRIVTIELREVPLGHGLEQLLKDCDVFVYSSGGNVRSAWIYDKGAGAELVPVPPESWASTADVERQMSGGSRAERIHAIETLVARNGPGAGDVVNRALLDDDAEVRLRALDVALSAGVSVSRETLTSLTYDSAASIRALALEAIASGTPLNGAREAETEQLARRMLGDPDPEVRTKASEILESRRSGN